jgi:hypothetical protein
MNKKIYLIISSIVVGVLFGFYGSFLTVVYFLSILLLVIAALILSLFVRKLLFKRNLKGNLLNSILTAILFLPFVFVGIKGQEFISLKRAKDVVQQIEEYQVIYKVYPENLDMLEIKQSKVKYYYNKIKKTYMLTYDIDGSYTHAYNSEFKNWCNLD